MATAVITGGTGFIGSHLVRSLVRGGDDVHLIVRSGSNVRRLRDLTSRIRLHHVDILDRPALAAMLHAVRPHHIFHLAGAGAAQSPEELVTINLLGTANLLAASDDVDYRGFVTTGDAFEYGACDRPLRESDGCEPLSLLGVSRLAATLHARAMARAKARPIVTLRLFSVYGPDDNPRRLVPRAIAAALSGSPISLSRPTVVRDWVYVDDVVALYFEAVRKAGSLVGQVFNVGIGQGINLACVIDTVARLTGTASEPRWGTFAESIHDPYRWVADVKRTFATFAWRPSVCLEEGLCRTIAAMSAHKKN